jgi:hypothetical protein
MTRPKVPPGRRRVIRCSHGRLGAKLTEYRPKAADGAGVRELQAEKAEGESRSSLFLGLHIFSTISNASLAASTFAHISKPLDTWDVRIFTPGSEDPC